MRAHVGISWASWIVACALGASCGADTPARDQQQLPAGSSAAVSGSAAPASAGASALVAGTGNTGLPGFAGTGATAGAGVVPPLAGISGAAGTAAVGGGAAGRGVAAGSGAAGSTPPGPPGTWAPADPGKTGPFEVTTENNVGHDMMYTMFRPKTLTQRHPVITWGNGTGTTPTVYAALLKLYASHGFIVIASNSMNVAQGTPPPMLDGVTWVLEQDMMEGTALYQHVDRDRIGATGHSQGAIAASSAGTDPRIKTVAPIETLLARNGLHGPALGLCGSMDTTVPCSGDQSSFKAITDQPVMYAELTSADHTNWIFSPGAMMNPYYVITNAWFRVQLMNDTALRPMFYGDCSICKDTATWITMRKMMDQ